MPHVDLRPLKERVLTLTGPELQVFRDMILSQPDELSKDEYIAKAPDWLRLLEVSKK